MDNFMQSMKVSELLAALDEFRSKLIAHRELWGKSLDDIVPGFPVSSQKELEEQSQWLTRRLGALRPYIERFDSNWIMQHPATGSMWDALDAASGLSSVSPIKAPSLRNAIEKLNSIAGRLEGLDQNDAVPVDRNVPIRSGVGPDRLMLAYMAHLHPYIAKGCSGLFADEHYPQAIEESAKAVFEYLREVTSLKLDGSALAQQAFSLKKPILAFSDIADETKKNEQIGFMEMLSAYAKGVRNTLAHTHGKQEEQQKAFEYLCLASLFCRRIDDATPKVK
jgi:uncharacterized protein (TIGR02391 family)